MYTCVYIHHEYVCLKNIYVCDDMWYVYVIVFVCVRGYMKGKRYVNDQDTHQCEDVPARAQ